MAIDYEQSSSANLVGDPAEGGVFSSGNKAEVSSATSASATATSAATTATNKATEAEGHATTASGHASTASNAAGTASSALSDIQTIQGQINTALSNAQSAQAAAEAALDSFDDSYLGPKSTDPTTDNDGDALTTGDLYYNTTSNNLKVYDGSAWQTAAQSTSQVFLKSNNFSDVLDASTARTNLGLGTMAEEASSDYAALAGATFTGTVESPEFSGALDGNVVFTAKAGEALSKGDVVYVSGISGQTPVVSKADANSTGKYPAFGVCDSSVSINQNLKVISQGQLKNIDTSAFSLGDTLYLSTTPGELTNVAPTGEGSVIQNLGKVEREHASSGSILVSGAGRSAATPNLNNGNIFIGDSNNKAVTASLSSKVAEALAGQQVPGTGIFTGDVSSSGLNLSDSDPRITLTDSDSNLIGEIFQDDETIVTKSAGNTSSVYGGFAFNGVNSDGLSKTRFQVLTSGNITFSNASGTPKFVWDANNERIGIGNLFASEALDVTGNIKASGEFIGNLSNATQQDITQLGTIGSLVATTADINGGTINQTTIAESDITVGSGKTLDVSAGTLTLADDQINPSKLGNGTISGSVAIDTTGSIETDSSVTASQFSVGTQYTLPSSDGSSDQVLITDGSGNVTFGDVPSSALTSHVATALGHANTASGHADSASASATSASGYATTATTKANEAAASAATATTKANEAAASESTTAGYVSSASSSAQAAANSASTANTHARQADTALLSAQAEATKATLAADAWDSYFATYLGASSSAPYVDIEGNSVAAGALYFDTDDNTMYVYNGTSWQAALNSTTSANIGANLTQNLNTNNFNIDLTDNDELRFGNNDQLIMTGRSYGGEISVDNNNLKLFINANIDSDVNLPSGRHFLKGFMVNNADEDGGILDPRILNDLAGAHKWANITYTNLYTNTERTNLVPSDSGAPFDPTSSHQTIYLPVGQEGTMEIDFDGIAGFTYTSFVGLSFGNAGTRCERVKIEVYRNGSWLTIRDVTDNPHSMLCNYVNQGSNSIKKIRYTFGNQVHSNGTGYFRLHTVFATNYQSGSLNGKKGVHYPLKYYDSEMSSNTTWNDSYKARFGDSGDLQIHHTNGTSYVADEGSGSLVMKSNSLRYQTDNSETRIISEEDHTQFQHEVWVEKTGGGNNTRLKLKGYDSTNYSDIGTLTGGSGFGGLIEGGNNGQLTIGLRNNDVIDGFNIVSGGPNPEYTDDLVYDKLCMRVQANGNTTINGATTLNDELKIRGGDAVITNYNTEGGAARIEIGGTTSAYLDLKTPYGDDFDLRLLHEASTNLSQINSKSDLKVVVNSMEAMRFDSENGHVGIGATNPSKLLTLASNDAPTVRLTNLRSDTNWDTDPLFGALEFYSNDPSGAGQGVRASVRAKADNQYGHKTNLGFHTSTDTGNNIERMLLGYNGQTTINAGTSSGTATLDVKDNTPIIRLTNKDTTLSGGNTVGAIQFKGSDQSEDGTDVLGGIYCISRDTTPDAYLSFRTHKNEDGVDNSFQERMRLTEEGKLRIGNTVSDPTYDLTISHTESSGTGTLGFNAGANNGHKIRYGGTGTNADVLKFVGVGDLERMRIDTNGNIGINETDPKEAFTIENKISLHNGGHKLIAFGYTPSDNNKATQTGHPASIRFDHNNSLSFEIDLTNRAVGDVSTRAKVLECKKDGTVKVDNGLTLGTGTDVLDTYEEGTWTPTASTNVTALSSVHGTYTKVGRLVTVNFTFVADLTNVAQFNIGGLPFAVGNNLNNTALESTGIVYSSGGNNPAATFMSYANHSSTQLVIGTTLSGTRTDNQHYRGSITYQT